MTKRNLRICVVDTVYTLMLYFIKFGFNDDDWFIVSTGIPKEIREKLNHYFFKNTKFHFSHKSTIANLNKKNYRFNIKFLLEIVKFRCIYLLKTFNRNLEVTGHAHLKFSFPLYECENNSILEDGLGNYSNLKESYEFRYPRFAHFFGLYFRYPKEGYGTHKNIKKVYLTKGNYPKEIADKVEVMDVRRLWDMKSDEEKNRILEFFNISEIYNQIQEDSTILITQSLSEDKLLPYDEEIEIYRKFVDKYPNLIIKTHPRESKDYHEIFEGIPVIDVPFPIELLSFMGIKISKIVTICSTVALNFKDECEIETYDGKTSSERINECIETIRKKMEN